MRIANDITCLIGRTPLVKLNKIIRANSNLVAAKLEQFNPCASIKDRTALGMVADAEKKGLLKPGSLMIEATSGNTGIALAFISAVRGYRLMIVMPESMSVERQNMLKIFGATVELTPAHLGMKGAIDRTLQIHKENEGSFLVRQFENPANTQIHEETTAEEILADTDGQVDVLILGVGTGGTLTGVARKLKAANPNVKIVAVEPSASAVLSGERPGAHMIQGIGAGFVPKILDAGLIDEIIKVANDEAFRWTRDLAQKEGILAGLSSGAVACAAAKFLERHPDLHGARIILIFPDTGERYISLSAFHPA
ncbi:MAG: cysteine synthase A [Elusimicrobia bacterium]|nr:cysteine synthase A [Elusimicrobiota bacterium]